MENIVTNFINHFHNVSPTENLTEVFTRGCCYWFAHILYYRFNDAELMFDEVASHFVVKIEDRLYDITGDVTDQYTPTPWEDVDPLRKERIIAQCANFIC